MRERTLHIGPNDSFTVSVRYGPVLIGRVKLKLRVIDAGSKERVLGHSVSDSSRWKIDANGFASREQDYKQQNTSETLLKNFGAYENNDYEMLKYFQH